MINLWLQDLLISCFPICYNYLFQYENLEKTSKYPRGLTVKTLITSYLYNYFFFGNWTFVLRIEKKDNELPRCKHTRYLKKNKQNITYAASSGELNPKRLK